MDFSPERFLDYLGQVNPGGRHMAVSARTGEGVDAFRHSPAAVAEREVAPA